MKTNVKFILPLLLISALLIFFAGCMMTPTDESPGVTGVGAITGTIAAPCCSLSGDLVTDPDCASPDYWCCYCQANWHEQDGIEVVLTYGENEIATTTTNEDGEYTFNDVAPGSNYVVTAYCPDYTDNRPLVKDVALQVASTFDAGMTDLVSTSLGLVVDFLVLYTEWGPEDISLDAVIVDQPTFPNFPKFKALIYETRRVLENCELNLATDEEVLYATCRAAEEISELEIGCGAGFTGGEGEGEEDDDCDGNKAPDITDVTLDGDSINDPMPASLTLYYGVPYTFCVTADDTADDEDRPVEVLTYYLTIDGARYYGTGNCITITPEVGDIGEHTAPLFVFDGCNTTEWGPITFIVDCCPFGDPGLIINLAQTDSVELSKNRSTTPTT